MMLGKFHVKRTVLGLFLSMRRVGHCSKAFLSSSKAAAAVNRNEKKPKLRKITIEPGENEQDDKLISELNRMIMQKGRNSYKNVIALFQTLKGDQPRLWEKLQVTCLSEVILVNCALLDADLKERLEGDKDSDTASLEELEAWLKDPAVVEACTLLERMLGQLVDDKETVPSLKWLNFDGLFDLIIKINRKMTLYSKELEQQQLEDDDQNVEPKIKTKIAVAKAKLINPAHRLGKLALSLYNYGKIYGREEDVEVVNERLERLRKLINHYAKLRTDNHEAGELDYLFRSLFDRHRCIMENTKLEGLNDQILTALKPILYRFCERLPNFWRGNTECLRALTDAIRPLTHLKVQKIFVKFLERIISVIGRPDENGKLDERVMQNADELCYAVRFFLKPEVLGMAEIHDRSKNLLTEILNVLLLANRSVLAWEIHVEMHKLGISHWLERQNCDKFLLIKLKILQNQKVYSMEKKGKISRKDLELIYNCPREPFTAAEIKDWILQFSTKVLSNSGNSAFYKDPVYLTALIKAATSWGLCTVIDSILHARKIFTWDFTAVNYMLRHYGMHTDELEKCRNFGLYLYDHLVISMRAHTHCKDITARIINLLMMERPAINFARLENLLIVRSDEVGAFARPSAVIFILEGIHSTREFQDALAQRGDVPPTMQEIDEYATNAMKRFYRAQCTVVRITDRKGNAPLAIGLDDPILCYFMWAKYYGTRHGYPKVESPVHQAFLKPLKEDHNYPRMQEAILHLFNLKMMGILRRTGKFNNSSNIGNANSVNVKTSNGIIANSVNVNSVNANSLNANSPNVKSANVKTSNSVKVNSSKSVKVIKVQTKKNS